MAAKYELNKTRIIDMLVWIGKSRKALTLYKVLQATSEC